MKKYSNLVYTLLAIPLVLSGCATQSIPLNSGAENVKIMDATIHPVALPSLVCQAKGEILGSNITPFKLKDTSFTENEIHLIKNKALLLNANLVVVKQNNVVVDGNYYNHVTVSDAYECNPYSRNDLESLGASPE